MAKISSIQKCSIIVLSIFLVILGFDSIVISTKLIDSFYFGLAILINICNIIFAIFVSFSIIRIRWFRLFVSILSIVLLLLNISEGIVQLIKMNNNENPKDKNIFNNGYMILFVFKIIVLIIIINTVFYAYWGIRICYRCEDNGDSSGSSYRSHHNGLFSIEEDD